MQRLLDPFEKIQFLYIMFPSFVKAREMQNTECQMLDEIPDKYRTLFLIPNSPFRI